MCFMKISKYIGSWHLWNSQNMFNILQKYKEWQNFWKRLVFLSMEYLNWIFFLSNFAELFLYHLNRPGHFPLLTRKHNFKVWFIRLIISKHFCVFRMQYGISQKCANGILKHIWNICFVECGGTGAKYCLKYPKIHPVPVRKQV